jgi:hypothetical protein
MVASPGNIFTASAKPSPFALDLVISGDGTERHSPHRAAETVMGVASWLAPVPIPYSLFDHSYIASADVDSTFRALAEISLIATGVDERGDGAFTAHRLVLTVMRDRLAEAGSAMSRISRSNSSHPRFRGNRMIFQTGRPARF